MNTSGVHAHKSRHIVTTVSTTCYCYLYLDHLRSTSHAFYLYKSCLSFNIQHLPDWRTVKDRHEVLCKLSHLFHSNHSRKTLRYASCWASAVCLLLVPRQVHASTPDMMRKDAHGMSTPNFHYNQYFHYAGSSNGNPRECDSHSVTTERLS